MKNKKLVIIGSVFMIAAFTLLFANKEDIWWMYLLTFVFAGFGYTIYSKGMGKNKKNTEEASKTE